MKGKQDMKFIKKIQSIRNMKQTDDLLPIASGHFFLPDGSVLAYPRDEGNTRQPYLRDGMMLWAYGCGYFRAQDGAFNIFPEVNEGDEPHIAFFATVNGETVALLGMPILEEPCVKSRYTVFTDNAVYYFTELEGITFALRAFISKEKELLFSLAILPEKNASAEITVSSYFNPFLRNGGGSHTLWYRYFKEGKVVDPETVTFYVTEGNRKDCDVFHLGIRQTAVEGCKVLYREQTTSRAQFNGGINHNVNNAKVARLCKIENPIHCTAFNDYAIAGDVITVKLQGNARFEYRFAISNEKADLSGAIADRKFEEIDLPMKSSLQFEIERIGKAPFSAKVLTAFLRKVQYQVNICALGKDMGGGGNIGFRDIAQQLEQCQIWNPEDSRAKLLFVLEHLFPDGRAPRTFTAPSEGVLPSMDLSNYIDMGIWMINAMDYYLRFTGDRSILNEVCGYYEIVDEDGGVIRKSDIRDSVLCHMIRIADRLVRNIAPDTGCVRMLYADWNDAIDSLGNTKDPGKKFGTGVSVMATLQAYENLSVMCRILADVGGHEKEITSYEKAMNTIRAGVFSHAIVEQNGEHRILHGWGDHRAFTIGGFHDIDGKARISSTSVSFFALSQLYDPKYEPDILSAYRKLDDKYGFRTFDTPFDPDLKGVGRIGKLPVGTAENAATYIHAALFAVLALYHIGKEKEATEQLLKLLPISYEKVDKTPFVMQNAYCYNPRIHVDGSALNDWFTGSAAVLMKTVITYLFGIQPQDDFLIVSPAKNGLLTKYQVTFAVHGRKIHLSVEKTGVSCMFLNGRKYESERIPYSDLMNQNELEVTY